MIWLLPKVSAKEKRPEPLNYKIKKEGDKFNLYDQDSGRRLGTHKTRQDALKQIGAIESQRYRDKVKKAEGILKQEGDKWVIYDRTGIKKLGVFTSKEDAVKRLKQIEFFRSKSYLDKGPSHVTFDKSLEKWILVGRQGEQIGTFNTREEADHKMRQLELYKSKSEQICPECGEPIEDCECDEDYAEAQTEPGKKPKKKLDPKAAVRNRPQAILPATHPKVTDNKSHFPIDTIKRGRNALSRVAQYSSVPPWFSGSLKELQTIIRNAVKRKYPSIEVTKDKSKSEMLKIVADNLYNQIAPPEKTRSSDGIDTKWYDFPHSVRFRPQERLPGTSTYDYDGGPKEMNKMWDKMPETMEETAIAEGKHSHRNIENPLGLHKHRPDQELGGGHLHGPSNQGGLHTHKKIEGIEYNTFKHDSGILNTSGWHIHNYTNIEDGAHSHTPGDY